MNDLNQVLLEGRLVREPDAKRLQSGATVCTFPIASNTYYFDKEKGERKEKATFMLIETWGNVAETCITYLNKGDGVRILGKIMQSRWTGVNRVKMERTYILADHVEFKSKSSISVPEPVKATQDEPNEAEQQVIDTTLIQDESNEVPVEMPAEVSGDEPSEAEKE